MTLTQLKYIIALAQEKHFGRAADFCCVSQPTLSIGIKKLEDELNMLIFDREQNQLATTAKGEVIVQRARQIVAETDDLKRFANSHDDPLDGVLKLGAIFTISPYLMPNLIPKIKQSAPKMPLALYENYTENLREKIKLGELDAIVISLPFAEKGCEVVDLYQEDFVAIFPKEHPLASQKSIQITDIPPKELLLLGAGHCFREQILNCYPERVLNAHSLNLFQGNSIETLKQMVITGLGVTILPKHAANLQMDTEQYLCMVPFSNPVPTRTVSLVYKKNFPRIAAIDLLIKTLQCAL